MKFNGWDCRVNLTKYIGGSRTAILLVDAVDGSPIATATVNFPEVALAADEVLIKDWSENNGILDALIAEGVVKDTGRRVPMGFVQAVVAKLLPKI